MNGKRVFYGIVALLVVLGFGLIGAAFGAHSLLKKQASTLVDLKVKNQTVASEQTELVKAKRDVETYASLNAIAKTIVPQDKDQAQAVREIVNIAAANGIQLGSITFSASTLGGTGTGSAPSTAAPAAPKSPLTQVQPVPKIPGVFQLPITIQQDSTKPITYSQFINFLTAIENNRRTAQVASINIQPTTDRSRLSFTLQVNEYIKP